MSEWNLEFFSENRIALIREIIREDLYPEDRFPETRFPNLIPLLMDVLQKHTASGDILSRPEKTDPSMAAALKRTVSSALSLENLVRHHPYTVVLMHRRLIESFIRRKHPVPDEREDLVQEMILRLMTSKMARIQKHYRCSDATCSSFTSYFMVAIRNMYIDITRERRMELQRLHPQPLESFDPAVSFPEKEIGGLVLQEELEKFALLLHLFHHLRPRLELCLKIKYRLPVSREDASGCFPGITEKDIKHLTRNYSALKDVQVFELLTPIFNRYEKKANKGDTLRKWISIKLEEIIKHLNNTHSVPVYTLDNLPDLVAMFYQRRGEERRIRHGSI